MCGFVIKNTFRLIGTFSNPLEFFYFALTLWACYIFSEQQTMAILMIVKDELTSAIFGIYVTSICLILSSGILRYTQPKKPPTFF